MPCFACIILVSTAATTISQSMKAVCPFVYDWACVRRAGTAEESELKSIVCVSNAMYVQIRASTITLFYIQFDDNIFMFYYCCCCCCCCRRCCCSFVVVCDVLCCTPFGSYFVIRSCMLCVRSALGSAYLIKLCVRSRVCTLSGHVQTPGPGFVRRRWRQSRFVREKEAKRKEEKWRLETVAIPWLGQCRRVYIHRCTLFKMPMAFDRASANI